MMQKVASSRLSLTNITLSQHVSIRTLFLALKVTILIFADVPNAGRGLPRLPYRSEKWDPDFREYLKKLDEKKPVILCGDLNVAHKEIGTCNEAYEIKHKTDFVMVSDIANPKSNKKNAGFTQQERDGFSALLEAGFVDSFREIHPEETGKYSYWTYMGNARAKNVGW
jgi:AP endonuclease-1